MSTAKKEYTFDFITGYRATTGKPIIIKRKVRANSISEAERKLKSRYPRAHLISLKGRIRNI